MEKIENTPETENNIKENKFQKIIGDSFQKIKNLKENKIEPFSKELMKSIHSNFEKSKEIVKNIKYFNKSK